MTSSSRSIASYWLQLVEIDGNAEYCAALKITNNFGPTYEQIGEKPTNSKNFIRAEQGLSTISKQILADLLYPYIQECGGKNKVEATKF